MGRAGPCRGCSGRFHALAVGCNWGTPPGLWGCSGEGGPARGWLPVSRPIRIRLRLGPEPAGMPWAGRRRGRGSPSEQRTCGGAQGAAVRDRSAVDCGAIPLGPGDQSGENGRLAQAGTIDGRHRARGLGAGGACRRADLPRQKLLSFSP